MRWRIWSLLVVVWLVLPGSIRADGPTPSEEEPIYQGRTLTEWLADMKDFPRRPYTARMLRVFGPRKEVMSALTAALQDTEDEYFIICIAETLRQFGSSAQGALPALRETFKRLEKPRVKKNKDELKNARQSIAEALVTIDDHPDPEYAPFLLEALKTKDADSRRDIVRKLGKLGAGAAKTTVPALMAILAETENAVRRTSSSGGGTLYAGVRSDEDPKKASELRLEAVKSLGKIGPAAKPALQALTMAMTAAAPEKNTRVQQLEVLDKSNGSQQAKARTISFTIVTGDKAMLLACAEALGRIRPEAKGTMAALRLALRDLDEDVRWAALCALLESGQDLKEVVPILLKFLRDKDASLRRVATEALGKTGGETKQIVPSLLNALQDSDAKVREAAAEALGKMAGADNEVIQALLAALGDNEIRVVQAAGRALWKFGPKAKAAVPRLLVLLDDSVAEKRLMGCFVLASIGPPAKEAVASLEKTASDDSTEYVRLAAYTALARIDPSRLNDALPQLSAALQRSVEKEDEDTLQVVVVSLILIGRDNREALSSLRKWQGKTSKPAVKVIDAVIEASGHPERDIFDFDFESIKPETVRPGILSGKRER